MSEVVNIKERLQLAETVRSLKKEVHQAMAYLPDEYWEDLAESWIADGFLPYEKVMQLFYAFWPVIPDEPEDV